MVWSPQFRRVVRDGDGTDMYVVGHPLVDEFLEFASGRARPNTVRAYAHDLKTFFTVVGKDPVEVRAADVLRFVKVQRGPRVGAENVVRISDTARVCRTRRSDAGWRRCRRSMAISSLLAMSGWRRTRCLVGFRHVGIDAKDAGNRWCGRCAGCRASSNPRSSPR